MSRATETRLRKLEVSAGVAGRRVFIFGAVEPGEAKRRELIACGEATGDDLFIFTGVPDRDPQSYVRFAINASGRVGAIAHARPAHA